MTLDVQEFKAFFETPDTSEDIKKKAKVFIPILKNRANEALKDGVALPKILDENDVWKPRSITLFDGYGSLSIDFKETNEHAKVVQKTKDTLLSLVK